MQASPAFGLRRRVQHLRQLALLTFLFCLHAPECLAQAQAVAAPATETVRLVNGAEYKGQIAERVPDSHVVIVTLTGEVKRFEWSEVAFAGTIEPVAQPVPATVEPAAAPAAVPIPAPVASGVSLDLQANHQGIMWHAQSDNGSERMLCMSPCTAQLEPGRYRLGLSSGSRNTVWEDARWEIKDKALWNGTYDSRRGSRIAGGVILGAGLAGSVALIISGVRANNTVDDACSSSDAIGEACDDANLDSPGTPRIVVGVIGAIASAVIGLALATRKDGVTIRPSQDSAGKPLGGLPEPAPVVITGTSGFEGTVWTCVDDASVRSLTLELQVAASGAIDKVLDVDNVSWGVRTCIRNNLPGKQADGGAGTRTVVLTR